MFCLLTTLFPVGECRDSVLYWIITTAFTESYNEINVLTKINKMQNLILDFFLYNLEFLICLCKNDGNN